MRSGGEGVSKHRGETGDVRKLGSAEVRAWESARGTVRTPWQPNAPAAADALGATKRRSLALSRLARSCEARDRAVSCAAPADTAWLRLLARRAATLRWPAADAPLAGPEHAARPPTHPAPGATFCLALALARWLSPGEILCGALKARAAMSRERLR